MNSKEILHVFETIDYWDCRTLQFECNHFADEVTLVIEQYNEPFDYKFEFQRCHKVLINTIPDDRGKPIKHFTKLQRPYFMHDVDTSEYELNDQKIIICKLLLPPLEAEIHFTTFTFEKIYDQVEHT